MEFFDSFFFHSVGRMHDDYTLRGRDCHNAWHLCRKIQLRKSLLWLRSFIKRILKITIMHLFQKQVLPKTISLKPLHSCIWRLVKTYQFRKDAYIYLYKKMSWLFSFGNRSCSSWNYKSVLFLPKEDKNIKRTARVRSC